jgi:hypothetical protein
MIPYLYSHESLKKKAYCLTYRSQHILQELLTQVLKHILSKSASGVFTEDGPTDHDI